MILLDTINEIFSQLVNWIDRVLFFSVGDIPLIILWMIFGGLFFTMRFGFISLRGFKEAIELALSNNSEGEGEVSPFEALTTALSATVGLGNIAGVAIAIDIGGVGSVFWMSVAAFLGMSSKFVECTLGQQYRLINSDGTISGGPMYYLENGLKEIGFPRVGRILGCIFALFCIGASFGGGNMFQVNQSFAALTSIFPQIINYDWLFGIVVAFFVGLVIIGGINRIGVVTSKLVPLMIGIYLVGCLWVIFVKIADVPLAINLIFSEAFSTNAIEGGLIGVLILAIRRSAFSNGAGLGTAAIAHSAANTSQPIKEGIVSMLEPFIDTILICNLTGLVIVLTDTYGDNIASDVSGSELTALAFASVISWFPYVLAVVIFLFGFSTTVAWSYYGEKAWNYLLGSNVLIYRLLFLSCIFIGAISKLGVVVDFSDMMLLAMAVPNIIGCVLLSNGVDRQLKKYWQTKDTLSMSNDRLRMNN